MSFNLKNTCSLFERNTIHIRGILKSIIRSDDTMPVNVVLPQVQSLCKETQTKKKWHYIGTPNISLLIFIPLSKKLKQCKFIVELQITLYFFYIIQHSFL